MLLSHLFSVRYSNRVKAETERLNNHELDDLEVNSYSDLWVFQLSLPLYFKLKVVKIFNFTDGRRGNL